MPVQDKIEGAKDNKFLGLKGVYRKGKQACLEKMGRTQRVAEPTEFRTSVDHTKALKASYDSISKGISSITGAVDTFRINMNTLSECYESMAKLLADAPLPRAMNSIAPGFKEIGTFCETFSSEVRTNIIPVFEKLTTTVLEELTKKKKEYNSLRFEHDEVKHSLDKALAKPAKASVQEKIKRLQKDYIPLHESYLNHQAEYMARSGYFESIIQRDAGLALMRLSKELSNWSGQVYRIFSDQLRFVGPTEGSLSAIPQPQYIPPQPIKLSQDTLPNNQQQGSVNNNNNPTMASPGSIY